MRAARIWFASGFVLVLAGCTTTHVDPRGDPSSPRPASHPAVPGTHAVPAVRGLQALYALRRLHAAKFMIVTFTARPGVEAAGIVVAQRPRSGAAVGLSTTVRLLVSAGRQPPGGEFMVPGVGTCEMGYEPPHSVCAGGPVMVHIRGR